MASVMLTPGAHPEMVPSSVANKNWLGADAPFSETTKPDPGLKTEPVGEAVFGPCAAGISTVKAKPSPWPSRRSDTPVLLSPNQNGPVGLYDMPQGFCKFRSTFGA